MTACIVVAALIALWKLSEFGRFETTCLHCGGRGAHRKGCLMEK